MVQIDFALSSFGAKSKVARIEMGLMDRGISELGDLCDGSPQLVPK